MSYMRNFNYRGRIVGKVNTPARQADGIHIKTIPKNYLDSDKLQFLILCLLDGHDYRIKPGGEINLKVTKNTKYGPLLNGIARAYYELHTGKSIPLEGQQRLVEVEQDALEELTEERRQREE